MSAMSASSTRTAPLALPERGLWAVADGMGGHARGDHASQLVDLAPRRPAADRGRPRPAGRRPVRARRLQPRARKSAAARDGLSGCTVVVLLAVDGHIACLWAGDSRLYRLRAGTLTQLTRDHSLVQELIDQGELTPEAARTHPWRNRITRAVGIDERLELEGAAGAGRARRPVPPVQRRADRRAGGRGDRGRPGRRRRPTPAPTGCSALTLEHGAQRQCHAGHRRAAGRS